MPLLAELVLDPEFTGRVLGIHLEGPFISREPGAHGAHKVECIRDGDAGLLDRLIDLARGHVRILTIAAEIPGSEAICQRAVENNIVVSLGHQQADGADLARLVAAGARMLTHLGNGIPNMIPRHDNIIFAGLANDNLIAGLITDGFHLPPAVLKVCLRAKTPARVVVVSDIVSLGGLPPGDYDHHGLGDTVRLEPNGYLHMPSRKCMAGSSRTMLQCMNHLHSLGILSLPELLQVGADNPLALLGSVGASSSTATVLPQLSFHPDTGFALL